MKERILAVLEKNSRISLHDLAALLGESEIDVANAIEEMERDHVICGYHTMINWENTSEEKVQALIEVRVTPQRGQGFDKIARRIYSFPEVDSCYLMSGGFDLMVIIEGKTMRDVALFVASKLSTLDQVLSTSTHFVLKKYKQDGTVFYGDDDDDERIQVTP
ncbi:MAG: Lrp/AsnC family transcriptional regulator [Lachnospiraceae bacterium]